MTSYPMERVLYNLHLRVCTYALRTSSNRSRSWAERGLLLLSICCFGALYMSHRSFVYRRSPPTAVLRKNSRARHHFGASGGGGNGVVPLTCLPSVPGFSRQAAVTHILLLDDYDDDDATQVTTASHAYTLRNGTLSTPDDTCHSYYYYHAPDDGDCQARVTSTAATATTTTSTSTTTSTRNTMRQPSSQQIYLSYSQVKGYLWLPPELLRDLPVQYVHVSPRDVRCFGEPFLQEIIFRFMSPETVILNWLLGLQDAQGYAYHPRTEALLDLHPSEEHSIPVLGSRIGFKLSVVLRTCFLFFITTTLVSFTLRETQERMLDFTHQLQNHVRHRQPVVHLVTRHFIDNLVFCPIMVGIIFFLIEFYHGDKALAFMVLSIVWLAEVFSVISLRSTNGLHFFPRIFFLLFSLFHFYLFSFPFGFTHAALACTALFMVHSMLFFWHRYELPAVALGRVSVEQPRMRPSHPPPSSHASSSSVAAVDAAAGTNPPPLRGEPPADETTPHQHQQQYRPAHAREGHYQRHHNNHPDDASRYPTTTTTTPAVTDPLVSGSGNSLSSLSANHAAETPRPVMQRSQSHVSNSSHGNNNNSSGGSHIHDMSRQTSASGLYNMGDEDGDESFVYFMGGEVVMPRRRPSVQQQRIPDHVLAAVDVMDATQTPVRDNLSASRQALGPDHPRSRTAPAFPIHMMMMRNHNNQNGDGGHSDHSRSSISSAGG